MDLVLVSEKADPPVCRIMDYGKFKTPTHRNISQTSPYMHDGRFKTLREVFEFYVQGGIENPNLDPDMGKLDLTEKEKLNLDLPLILISKGSNHNAL